MHAQDRVPSPAQPSGMRTFTIVWFGQLLSFLGTTMTQFALSLWAWEVTGQATALSIVGVFSFLPSVLFSPLAGVWVDRWNRKLVMMLSDVAAGVGTVAILMLYLMGRLEIWHLCLVGAIEGAFQAFQFPAYSAAVTLLISKEQYGRASGMLSLARSTSGIFAPMLAAMLFGVAGLGGVLIFDIVTLVLAVGILFFVHIPQPEFVPDEGNQGSFFSQIFFGFRYILDRPGLLGLQLIFFAANLLAMLGMTLTTPMILARTGNQELVLGTVRGIGSAGGVLGALILSAWGGPKHRVHGVLGGMSLAFLAQIPMGLGRGPIAWAASWALLAFILPFLNGANQAIWQAKVPPHLQGRVFATRRVIAQIIAPLAIGVAGPLADYVFEPAMAEGGPWADTFAWLVGTGPGAGMALLIAISGLIGMLTGVVGYLSPIVREVERRLPDHDAVAPA